jgi:hypothetical protein
MEVAGVPNAQYAYILGSLVIAIWNRGRWISHNLESALVNNQRENRDRPF